MVVVVVLHYGLVLILELEPRWSQVRKPLSFLPIRHILEAVVWYRHYQIIIIIKTNIVTIIVIIVVIVVVVIIVIVRLNRQTSTREVPPIISLLFPPYIPPLL